MSSASERANGPASGPVLQSVFLVVLAHSAGVTRRQSRIAAADVVVVHIIVITAIVRVRMGRGGVGDGINGGVGDSGWELSNSIFSTLNFASSLS